MKTAMAAVGIGLIVQLVQYLIENFDELSKGSNGVAKALRFVGDIIGEILLMYQPIWKPIFYQVDFMLFSIIKE